LIIYSFTNVDEEGAFFGPSGGSGGYLECIFKYAAKELFGIELQTIEYKPSRVAGWKEGMMASYPPQSIVRINLFCKVTLEVEGKTVLHFALAYGFPSIQNLIRKMNNKKVPCPYHYIEVLRSPATSK